MSRQHIPRSHHAAASHQLGDADDTGVHGHNPEESFDYPQSPLGAGSWGDNEDLEQDGREDAEGREALDEGDEEDELDHEGEHEEEEDDEEEEEEYDNSSETSSAVYDPKTDPEGFARRLDELAGVLEMGEVEARALKWGAPIKPPPQGIPAGQLSPNELRDLLDKHLTSTEWKYNLAPLSNYNNSITVDRSNLVNTWGGVPPGIHPIRVTPRSGLASEGGMGREGSVLGIEGLPNSR